MTLSYGEQTAERLMEEHTFIVTATLRGDREALQRLLAVAAQSGYTTGYGAAAAVVGVTL